LPDEGLTIEDSNRVGGFFARVADAVWKLNSRNRPKNIGLPNLPGTEGQLNSLGNAILEESDISGLEYSTQDKLADAIRASHVPVSTIVTSTEVVAVRKNRNVYQPGIYEVEVTNKRTGEILTVFTDRITTLTGLGKEIMRLNKEGDDEETRAIIENDQRVYDLPKLVEDLGDKTNQFPLQKFKRPIVIGAKDSGNIIVGALLGAETQLRKTTTQLDWIQEINWVGQESTTKEEVDRSLRIRYQQLGLSFPREAKAGEGAEYYSRVKPTGKARALRMERDGENIRVVFELFDEDGSSLGIESVEGDAVFLTTGFYNTAEEPLRFINTEEMAFSPDTRLDAMLPKLISNPGSRIYYKEDSPLKLIEFIDYGMSGKESLGKPSFDTKFSLRVVGKDNKETIIRKAAFFEILNFFKERGQSPFDFELIERVEVPSERSIETELVYQEQVDTKSFTLDDLQNNPKEVLQELPVIEIELTGGRMRRFEVLSFDSDSDNFRIKSIPDFFSGGQVPEGRILERITVDGILADIRNDDRVANVRISTKISPDPIAKKVRGEEIYIAASAADLPVTDNERREAPVLEQIGENTVAIFRQSKKVVALGKRNARLDKERIELDGGWLAENVAKDRPKSEKVVVPEDSIEVDWAVSGIKLSLNEINVGRPLPDEFNGADFLKLVVGSVWGNYEFPTYLKSINLSVTRTSQSKAEKEKQKEMGIKMPVIDVEVTADPSLSEPAYQEAVRKLLSDPVMGRLIAKYTDSSHSSLKRMDIEIPLLDGKVLAEDVSYSIPRKKRAA
jgi:hypothetical protein